MNFLLDIAILLIFSLTVYINYRRGFVDVILGFGRMIFSVIAAACFGKTVGAFLAVKFFDSRIVSAIYNSLENACRRGESLLDFSNLNEKIPTALKLISERCGVDLETIVSNADGMAGEEELASLANSIGLPISAFISNIVGYIVVFLVAYLVFMILAWVLSAVLELPVLRTFNKLLGICVGCISGVIVVTGFVSIVQVAVLFFVAANERSAALEIINKTVLFKHLCLGGI